MAKVFTYSDQPCDNVDAWRLGEACRNAADEPKCGDYIDRGLILLRELQARGYGIVRLEHPTQETAVESQRDPNRCNYCGKLIEQCDC